MEDCLRLSLCQRLPSDLSWTFTEEPSSRSSDRTTSRASIRGKSIDYRRKHKVRKMIIFYILFFGYHFSIYIEFSIYVKAVATYCLSVSTRNRSDFRPGHQSGSNEFQRRTGSDLSICDKMRNLGLKRSGTDRLDSDEISNPKHLTTWHSCQLSPLIPPVSSTGISYSWRDKRNCIPSDSFSFVDMKSWIVIVWLCGSALQTQGKLSDPIFPRSASVEDKSLADGQATDEQGDDLSTAETSIDLSGESTLDRAPDSIADAYDLVDRMVIMLGEFSRLFRATVLHVRRRNEPRLPRAKY